MITAVDTNVIVDILTGNPWGDASLHILERQLKHGALLISGQVYAELLAAGVWEAQILRRHLREARLTLDLTMGEEIWERAAAAWQAYLAVRRLNKNLQCCFFCGHPQAISCPGCGEPLAGPRHIMADFLIGAHASIRANALVTRDRGLYGSHFPELNLVRPEI